jgi:hypothetical protein
MVVTFRRSAAIALLAALSACADAPMPTSPAAPSLSAGEQTQAPLATPRFEARTPTYPAIAVYIVYREYVNLNPHLTHVDVEDPHYQRYMEKRLRELYPERGYAGMMRESAAELRQHQRRWVQYEEARRRHAGGIGIQSCDGDFYMYSSEFCEPGGSPYVPPPEPTYDDDPSWIGQEEFVIDNSQVLTVQQHADSLQATADEYDRLVYFESLALGDDGGYHLMGAGSRDDLIRHAATGLMPGEMTAQGVWGLHIVIPVSVFGACAVRGYFAYRRARATAQSYYPHLSDGDTKHDAFRHVYASMMLRRYCSAPVAKAVTDINEWGETAWGPRVMDYHNNDLGREVRYRHFRGHWFSDRWSWGVWGHRVRRYIDDANNGAFVPALNNEALSEATARSISQTIPGYWYIYIREQ